MAELHWRRVTEKWHDSSQPDGYTYRAKIAGGWLVSVWAGDKTRQDLGGGLTFVPDHGHSWECDEEPAR
jgi:hypothetical protein